MTNQKVVTRFARYKDADLEQKAQHILVSLTGNANFPNPTPALADFQTAITNYAAALEKAQDGTKQDTALKNQARDVLENLIAQLALYVQLNSKDDVPIMLSSGFDVSKPPAPVGILDKPQNLIVAPSAAKGSVDVSVNAVAHASGYQYEFTDAPLTATSVWAVITDTSTFHTISNLQSGKEYAFRVTAIGSDPTRVYSDVINSFVL